jgi:hypothetical protein
MGGRWRTQRSEQLQFEPVIDHDGQVADDRWLARELGVVAAGWPCVTGSRSSSKSTGGQRQFIFLLPLRMQFADKTDGLAGDQNTCTAARMQGRMRGLLEARGKRYEQALEIALEVEEVDVARGAPHCSGSAVP